MRDRASIFFQLFTPKQLNIMALKRHFVEFLRKNVKVEGRKD